MEKLPDSEIYVISVKFVIDMNTTPDNWLKYIHEQKLLPWIAYLYENCTSYESRIISLNTKEYTKTVTYNFYLTQAKQTYYRMKYSA